MNNYVEETVLSRSFVWFYPLVLLFGLLVNLLVSAQELDRQKHEYYLLSSRNAINKVFAYQGNQIFLITFILLAALQIHIHSKNQDLLPRNGSSSPRTEAAGLARQYAIKFLLKQLLLYVVFYIIDHVFIWTGGVCSISKTRSAERCRVLGGSWEGGFDISGHFCFLTNVSLILWYELYHCQKYISDNELRVNRKFAWIEYLTLFVLAMWLFVLSVTATYYHTVGEKVLGLVMGYTCPTVMYILIPSTTKLNKLMY